MPAGFLVGWALFPVASLLCVGWLARLGERFARRAAQDGVRVGAPVDGASVDCPFPEPGPGSGHPQKSVLVVSGCAWKARNPQEVHRHAITVADTRTAIDWIVENEGFFSSVILDVSGIGLDPCRAFRRDLRNLGLTIPVALASFPPIHGLRTVLADFEPALLIAVSDEKRHLGAGPAGMLQEAGSRGMMRQSDPPGEGRPSPGKGWTPRVIRGGAETGG